MHGLQPFGAPDAKGDRWYVCACCGRAVLISADAEILRTRAAPC